MMSGGRTSIFITFCLFLIFSSASGQKVSSALTLKASDTKDQDDMCFWLHPSEPAKSTIIASDKEANIVFVYDLDGNTVQALSVPGKPGNIDIRYGFSLGGEPIDIVIYNDRTNSKIAIYKVDPATRKLQKIDNNAINIGANYGICAYISPVSGKFYAFTTAKDGSLKQFELFEDKGKIGGKQVRNLNLKSQTEGCVCDDETAQAYFGEEEKGIWKIGAEPDDGTAKEMIAKAGDGSGLKADVEGLSIYYAADGEGYIIASSQGADKFTIIERKAPHKPVGEFEIEKAGKTDGIDVINLPLGGTFSGGLFAYHNGQKEPFAVGLVKWEDIAGSVGNLMIDTEYWDPRRGAVSTAVAEGEPEIPSTLTLLQNYPNPFNPSTVIPFRLDKSREINLTIIDLLGRTVRTLAQGRFEAGSHLFKWDGRNKKGETVSAGIYLYQLRAKGVSFARKLMFIR